MDELREKLIEERAEYLYDQYKACTNVVPFIDYKKLSKQNSFSIAAESEVDWFLAKVLSHFATDEQVREKIAKELAIKYLEDESLAGCYVWEWVKENGYVDEYLKLADSILPLLSLKVEAAKREERERIMAKVESFEMTIKMSALNRHPEWIALKEESLPASQKEQEGE